MKAIFFDLDCCLVPAKAFGEDIFIPVFEGIEKASQGQFTRAQLDEAFADFWRHPYDLLAKKNNFTPEMYQVGATLYSQLTVNKLVHQYDDLDIIPQLPQAKHLVTTGFAVYQQSKVDVMGIRPLFNSVHVDELGVPNRIGKQGIFAQLMQENNYAADEVLVIGDSPNSEIQAGNNLGLKTVQILRPGISKHESAKHHITGLAQLFDLL